MAGTIDEARLGEFMGQMVGYMTGGALCFAMRLGDELGLYRALAGAGPLTADALADATGCNRRLVREWLDGQAAGGLIGYDPEADAYELSAEAAAALADDGSPAFVARGMNALASLALDQDKIAAAFRGDGGLGWADHHPCLFSGTEWFFRTGYRAYLPTNWFPALDGVEAKLRAGGTVADIGCGHGASAVVMAQAYPDAQVRGFDNHTPSVEIARQRATEAGVADRATFEVADAKSYPGRYDPFARDDKAANLAANPMAALFYTASSAICTPNSLSQDVALGLGAQAGESRLRQVFKQAGFSQFRRAAETPVNLILEARP